ncbi:MAG: hypothetical protein WBB95_18945 [Pseudomonas sp.]|uniref:hypothetical protein n=1 Tax=Pseudomonas sp. TaxID=306 RepID=UPI003C71BEA6
MFKYLITPLCVTLSLASAPALANSAAGNGAIGSVNVAGAEKTSPNRQTFDLSCTSGNFSGDLRGYVSYNNHDSSKYVLVEEYRIARTGDQDGGNKANVNLKEPFAKKSSDSMKQDGQWHRLNWAGWVSAYNVPLEVEFIFDKSGADPRCTASQRI